MKERLKKLHYVMYGEDYGRESPFGFSDEFPGQDTLKDFFAQAKEEFPNYAKFGFDCEEQWVGRYGLVSYQWWLIGEKE